LLFTLTYATAMPPVLSAAASLIAVRFAVIESITYRRRGPVEPEFGGLIDGTVVALILIVVTWLLSRVLAEVWMRVLLAVVLVIAAVVYVGFAANAGGGWMTAEVAAVVVYGALGVLGIRGSRWWLVAGWAAHPLWDVVLQHVGPGRSFAPDTYTVPCLSFVLLVALYIAVAGRS
jgi:hypothetical protein